MKLVTVDQMRRIEKDSDARGHTYAQMMELAGRSVARTILDRMAVRDKHILFLIGPGNNGGDGLVAARHLHDAGAKITVYLLQARSDGHIAELRERYVTPLTLANDRDLQYLRQWLYDCDVIVDALLGTGASRPIGGDLARLLTTVGQAVTARRAAVPGVINPALPAAAEHAPSHQKMGIVPLIVAVDGPTGLNYDTGELDPLALPADLSVTFAYPKVGHTRLPGAGACGELLVADIGTNPSLANDVELELADPTLIRSLLPDRPIEAHKGAFGKVMIVAGSMLYTGAPVLAATAAYRAGAGLVTLATPRSIHAIMASKINEATFLPLPDQSGVLSAEAVDELREKIGSYTVGLIGPGITTEARAFIEKFFGEERGARGKEIPLVIDADALNILAQIDHWWTRVPAPAILTPHPGEMSRLTRLSMKEIEADRLRVAIESAKTWGHVVVLKGAFSVIASPDGRSIIMPFANPALATAGSGDVLAGTIAAMRAQGLAAYEAAICGTYLHGAAGEIARREIGSAGVIAGDLLMRLPQVLTSLK